MQANTSSTPYYGSKTLQQRRASVLPYFAASHAKALHRAALAPYAKRRYFWHAVYLRMLGITYFVPAPAAKQQPYNKLHQYL